MESMTPDTRACYKPFYLISGYGPPAVMVFFVLSGLLIGSSVIQSASARRWSWRDYLMARGIRLYIVLVPALVLTTFWDCLGLAASEAKSPNDDTAMAIVTREKVAASCNVTTFFGNLAFLQKIAVPTFGSNTALWSLTNEAWYYVIFPCLWLAFRPGPSGYRLAYLLLATAFSLMVGREILFLFPVWLLGVILAFSPRLSWARSQRFLFVSAVPLVITLAMVALNKIPAEHYMGRYAVAVTFSVFLFAVLQQQGSDDGMGMYARTAALLAGFSYTLYLTHLPILVFLRAVWTYERAWPSDLLHWCMEYAVCLGCIVYAYLISRLTESRTERVRGWLKLRFFGPNSYLGKPSNGFLGDRERSAKAASSRILVND
jgi:peptidoglycan/LPS O-acetylase OafA/YrhL